MVLGGGLALTGVLFIAVWIPGRNQPRLPPTAEIGKPPPTLRPEAPPGPRPQAVSLAHTVVTILTSQPTGAAVVRLTDDHVLGVTPWRQTQPAQTGELALELRLPGYRPRPITLHLDQDSTYNETLLAEPPPRKTWPASRPAAVAANKREHPPAPVPKVAAPPPPAKENKHDPASRIID